jgi:uncharacterized Tic20 family protein
MMTETNPTAPAGPSAGDHPADEERADRPPTGNTSIGSGNGGAQGVGAPNADSRNMAVVAHLSALVMLAGVPGFVGPLVVWLLHRDRDRDHWVAAHARDALNFQLSLLVYAVGALALAVLTLGLGLLVAIPVIVVAIVASVAVPIVAALRAADGERYRYPATLQLIS